jgi:ribonucleoside-diphosphate reductase alpha chain
LYGVRQLDYVKKAQQGWVEHGTNIDLCVDKNLRHNISNTITVDDWDEVEQYLFDNRYFFAGVSLLPITGDKIYAQAPFTEVITAEQIMQRYGQGSMFASGVIVDGLHAFNNNLWMACDTLLGYGEKLTDDSSDLLKRDWIRRAKKYANNFFDGDMSKMTYCLKDCFNLHKWLGISMEIVDIDFSTELKEKRFVDVDTLGSQGCAGGACEVTF